MADIFVSYASEDRERVRPLVEELEARGFSVWWDTRIGIGTSFDRQIEQQLKAASSVITVWSTASVDSNWVREETQDGLEREILIPIQIDDCQLPLGFRRTQVAQLIGWPDTRSDLSRLFDRVAELTGRVATADAESVSARERTRGANPNSEKSISRLFWPATAALALLIVAFLLARSVWFPATADMPITSERWVQLTDFPDSAGQPVLSPDGRMLAFVRGPGSFVTPGQIYSMLLPDGTPVPLTQDSSDKMSPVFSPDGSRIAYTVVSGQFEWDTWRVEALGGNPGFWLGNASGLVWTDAESLLFSEVIPGEGLHMKVVTARETREKMRDIYVPEKASWMAHRSAPSPDGQWAIIVEMDEISAFRPCRLVSLNGSGENRQVGPSDGSCTFAAWSPDGDWMYFTSSSSGMNHIWRQNFPDGQPEQVTAGATTEEGIAVSPDGGALITAVALKKSSVWISDHGVERAISREGYAFDPEFTPDGRYLFFRISKGAAPISEESELWTADLQTGRLEAFLPGFSLFGFNAYDISANNEVVLASWDSGGKARLWLAPVDRSAPPRQVPNVEGDEPFFGTNDEIFFRGPDEDKTLYVYRVGLDGRGLRKAVASPIANLDGVSPDGRWVVALAQLATRQGRVFTQAFPLNGGSPLPLYAGAGTSHKVDWTSDHRYLLLAGAAGGPWLEGGGSGRTSMIPVPEGQIFPDIPLDGYQEEAISAIPGAKVFESGDVVPGPTPEVFAFSRQTAQRNLYRIPLP